MFVKIADSQVVDMSNTLCVQAKDGVIGSRDRDYTTGSNPVLTTDNNNSGVRVLLRRKVVFSTVRVRVRWRNGRR